MKTIKNLTEETKKKIKENKLNSLTVTDINTLKIPQDPLLLIKSEEENLDNINNKSILFDNLNKTASLISEMRKISKEEFNINSNKVKYKNLIDKDNIDEDSNYIDGIPDDNNIEDWENEDVEDYSSDDFFDGDRGYGEYNSEEDGDFVIDDIEDSDIDDNEFNEFDDIINDFDDEGEEEEDISMEEFNVKKNLNKGMDIEQNDFSLSKKQVSNKVKDKINLYNGRKFKKSTKQQQLTPMLVEKSYLIKEKQNLNNNKENNILFLTKNEDKKIKSFNNLFKAIFEDYKKNEKCNLLEYKSIQDESKRLYYKSKSENIIQIQNYIFKKLRRKYSDKKSKTLLNQIAAFGTINVKDFKNNTKSKYTVSTLLRIKLNKSNIKILTIKNSNKSITYQVHESEVSIIAAIYELFHIIQRLLSQIKENNYKSLNSFINSNSKFLTDEYNRFCLLINYLDNL
jgi:hypothetical protein